MPQVQGQKTVVFVKSLILYIFMSVGAVFVLFPFFWMIFVAVKPEGQAFSLTVSFAKPLWKNFISIATDPSYPFWRFFINSVIVATSGGLLTTLFCSMGGYVFAKKDFYGKNVVYWFLLSTMMIPGMMFLVPQFAIVTKLNWINTYSGMVLPHVASVFGIFLMRQYIETVPTSLIESAKIDGASELQIFSKIIVPLSMAVMTTLFLLTFLFHWSNFLWHLVVNTPDSSKLTIPVGLALFRGQYQMDWEKMMAASCFAIIPIVIIFLIAQKFFIEGLTTGAVKE